MVVRSLLKTGVSAPLAWSGGAEAVGRITGKGRLPLVIGYHRVVEDYASASRHAIDASLISRATLIRQLEWICRHYEICSLDELRVRTKTVGAKGKPPAAITFDDGYADVFGTAMPLLIGKGIPFAVFVATDLVGSRDLLVHDELYLRLALLGSRAVGSGPSVVQLLHRAGCWQALSAGRPAVTGDPYRLTREMLCALNQRKIRQVLDLLRAYTQLPECIAEQSRVMDWSMVETMQRAGVVIGCHTRSHAILTNEDERTLFEEIDGSRAVLENHLGQPVTHFAYPDGAFDETVVRAVARAGFRHAYTVCFHRSRAAPELTIPRRMLWERSNVNVLGRFSRSILECQLNGVFDARSGCSAAHG